MNKAQREFTHQTVGILLIALIIVMGLAGANPDLHHALHQNSACAGGCHGDPGKEPEASEHICGVTLLQTGAIFLVDTPVLEPLGLALARIETWEAAVYSALSFRLPQGRAPPIAGIV